MRPQLESSRFQRAEIEQVAHESQQQQGLALDRGGVPQNRVAGDVLTTDADVLA